MKISAVLIVFLLLIANLSPDSVWTRTYGGTNIDIGHAVQQTSDQGFIMTGYTRSFGTASGRNVWLLKTDSQGNEQWSKTFGGNSDDEGTSVRQTQDGGYIITGYTASFGSGLKDVYIIKTDSLGNEQWFRFFGGANDEEGYSVRELPGGGYIIAAATSSSTMGSRDGFLIKLTSTGSAVWTRLYGGLSTDGFRSVEVTQSGGYILTGWTASDGAGALGKAWLVLTDSSGAIIFNKNFGGTSADRGYHALETRDGGYIMAGYTASIGAGNDDMYLVKTDAVGNLAWQKTFGGTGRDYGHSLCQTQDDGFLITGYTLSTGAGGDDVWLVKTTPDGTLETSRTFGGTSSDVGYWIDLTSDGGFVITGHTLSSGAGVHDLWLIKSTPDIVPVELTAFSATVYNGRVLLNWSTASETNNRGFEIQRATSVETMHASSLQNQWQSIGFISGNGTTADISSYIYTDISPLAGKNLYRLKQIDFDGTVSYSEIVSVETGLPEKFVVSQNYPNPFNPETTVSFYLPEDTGLSAELFSVTGELVKTLHNGLLHRGSHHLRISSGGLSSGAYILRLSTGKQTKSIKLMISK